MAKKNTNPPCPKCKGKTRKNGTAASGLQKYRCMANGCGHGFIPGATMGRPKKKGGAMTPAERKRAQRVREKESQNNSK